MTTVCENPFAQSVVETVFNTICLLEADLAHHRFETCFDVGRAADAKQWLKG